MTIEMCYCYCAHVLSNFQLTYHSGLNDFQVFPLEDPYPSHAPYDCQMVGPNYPYLCMRI